MREIIFRGKTDKGEWVQGLYYHQTEFYGEQCSFHYIIESCDELEDNMMYVSRVDPETVGQYTGLTDKNGTKIFEGDIVSISGDFKGIYTCVWEEHHFDYEFENKTMRFCLACVYSDDIKVIGNIHDNPELLKGGEE